MNWRVPYLVASCAHKFNIAVKQNDTLGKSDYMKTLSIEDEVLKTFRRPIFTGICRWKGKLSMAIPPEGPFWLENGTVFT